MPTPIAMIVDRLYIGANIGRLLCAPPQNGGVLSEATVRRSVCPSYAGSFYWATVCKTLRPILSDRCLSVCPVLSVCLSVSLVCCGQTVGWIQMKLGMQVGLGPGHISKFTGAGFAAYM